MIMHLKAWSHNKIATGLAFLYAENKEAFFIPNCNSEEILLDPDIDTDNFGILLFFCVFYFLGSEVPSFDKKKYPRSAQSYICFRVLWCHLSLHLLNWHPSRSTCNCEVRFPQLTSNKPLADVTDDIQIE